MTIKVIKCNSLPSRYNGWGTKSLSTHNVGKCFLPGSCGTSPCSVKKRSRLVHMGREMMLSGDSFVASVHLLWPTLPLSSNQKKKKKSRWASFLFHGMWRLQTQQAETGSWCLGTQWSHPGYQGGLFHRGQLSQAHLKLASGYNRVCVPLGHVGGERLEEEPQAS